MNLKPCFRVSPPSLHANEEMLSEDSEEEEMDRDTPTSRDTPTIAVNNGKSRGRVIVSFDLVLVFLCTLVCAVSSVLSGPNLSSASIVLSASAPTSVRSDSASPYDGDDDSFADFVAKEALTNAVGDHSHSPTPNPTHLSQQSVSSDIHALLNHIHQQSPAPSTDLGSAHHSPAPPTELGSALVSQFGVTASCPPVPVQLPEGAPQAVRYVMLVS